MSAETKTLTDRELDALVAKHVMDLPVCDSPSGLELPAKCSLYGALHYAPDGDDLPRYSTDDSATAAVEARLHALDYVVITRTAPDGDAYCRLLHRTTGDMHDAHAETRARALCFAALGTVEVG